MQRDVLFCLGRMCSCTQNPKYRFEEKCHVPSVTQAAIKCVKTSFIISI